MSSPDLIIAQPDDAEGLASLSHAAKLSYRAWAQPGWEPPVLPAERARRGVSATPRVGL